MGQHHVRIALQRFKIALRETFSGLIRRKQFLRLRDQALGCESIGWLFGIQRLVDQYHQLRQLMQPVEPWIVQHQFQKIGARLDPFYISLIYCALGVEQDFVQAEQAVAQIREPLVRRRGRRRNGPHRTPCCYPTACFGR
jgi:hypothetical protein